MRQIMHRINIINRINGDHKKSMFRIAIIKVMVGIKLMILVISSTFSRIINTLIPSINKNISNIIPIIN